MGSAIAQTSVALIDADFAMGTISTNGRIRTNQANGEFFKNADSEWTIADGVISSAATTPNDLVTEGALSQVIATDNLATDLTHLTLSFDYVVGATATLRLGLIGYTLNTQAGQNATNTLLMNNGTANGNVQNNTQAELRYGDINLLTGADMTQSLTNDLTFASGTSSSHSVTFDLTNYAWHADEAAGADPANSPGLSGGITSIADFDYVVLVVVNDLSTEGGATPTTLDNIQLTVMPEPVTTVPNIISIELDESGNVVLTLDGPEIGLTAQQSDDLSTDTFVDVASTPEANTLTIDSADVDPNADGTSFYRVRN